MRRRHLLTWVVLFAMLCAGCGVRPSNVITGGPAPSGRAFGAGDVPGGPDEGAALYFLAGASLTPVLRPAGRRLSPAQTLALLQKGPTADERAARLRSEVPTGLDPVTITTDAAGNVEVVVSADVTKLSAAAVDQIVCTVRDALPTTAPVTVTSDAGARDPRTCPAG
jgi:sporulation and spore germination protein